MSIWSFLYNILLRSVLFWANGDGAAWCYVHLKFPIPQRVLYFHYFLCQLVAILGNFTYIKNMKKKEKANVLEIRAKMTEI